MYTERVRNTYERYDATHRRVGATKFRRTTTQTVDHGVVSDYILGHYDDLTNGDTCDPDWDRSHDTPTH